ncbi:unnamed protein product [Diamesa tonsa]
MMKSVLFACVILVAIVSAMSAKAKIHECVAKARAEGKTPDEYYYPHESDCNLFYQCAKNGPVMKHCPDNLHFHSKTNNCEYPEKAGCAV